jgi:triphosphoribosyl-dephospho-CoA synthase
MMALEAAIGEAFEQACIDELLVPKPGNVHLFSGGHDMTVEDFTLSAKVAAPFIAARGKSIGERIYGAVEASFEAVRKNSNLGIVLLSAPLARAAEHSQGRDLRVALRAMLSQTDLADAALAYKAIRLAAPGGLGEAAEHDVRFEPSVSLVEAMSAAASRDSIARQYQTGFADVFEIGLSTLRSLRRRHADKGLATLGVYLTFLAAWPDTHIVRKHGLKVAQSIVLVAKTFLDRLDKGATLAELQADLLSWDGALKHERINPGSSADLTVATLFAARLECILRLVWNSD